MHEPAVEMPGDRSDQHLMLGGENSSGERVCCIVF